MSLPDCNPYELLKKSESIYSASEVLEAVEKISHDLSRDIANTTPVILSVLQGASMFTAHLVTRLNFPLQIDCVDVSRYQGNTYGGELLWRVFPKLELNQRVVVLVDDILDEGVTLAALKKYCLDAGASRVLVAVLVNKELGHSKPIVADYVGLTVPNRYVFGFGMDIHGWWRNLPAIYALNET